MSKTVEQLQDYLDHYQAIYSRANGKGKAVVRSHISKLKRKINRLQIKSEKPSRTVQVLVDKDLAHSST